LLRSLAVSIALLCTYCLALGGTLDVPGQYVTIGEAMLSASDGDTVVVQPGLYTENVRIEMKEVCLVSTFIFDSTRASIEATIIDGSNPSNPDQASAVTITGSSSGGSAICGFTITGGVGTFLGNRYAGGGVMLIDCPDVNVSSCIIADNNASFGGGIAAYNCSPTIEYCTIETNSSAFAGAIDLENAHAVVRNFFFSGTAATESGGAIRTNSSPSAVIIDNVIFDNTTTGLGCVECEDGIPSISYNDFWNNSGEVFINCDPDLGDTTCCTNYNRIPSDAFSNIFRDPMYVETDSPDSSVDCASPIIDAGSTINQEPPWNGFKTDIGPTEYPYLGGDMQVDDFIDIEDIVYLIDFLFSETSIPCPIYRGDYNCDAKVNITDVNLLVAYIFRGGVGPCGTVRQ